MLLRAGRQPDRLRLGAWLLGASPWRLCACSCWRCLWSSLGKRRPSGDLATLGFATPCARALRGLVATAPSAPRSYSVGFVVFGPPLVIAL